MRGTLGAGIAATALAFAGGVVVAPAVGHATSAGDNGLIAFVRDGEVYTADASGHHLKQLTHTKKSQPVSSPKWSPDGTHIAYVVSGSGSSTLWEMRANGSHQTKLWKGMDPAWSPDGKTLAYVAKAVTPPTNPKAHCPDREVFTRPLTGGTPLLINDMIAKSCAKSSDFTYYYGTTISWSQEGPVVWIGVAGTLPQKGSKKVTGLNLVVGAHTAGTDVGPQPISDSIILTTTTAAKAGLTSVPSAPGVDAAPDSGDLVISESLATKAVAAGRLQIDASDDSTPAQVGGDKNTELPVFSPDDESVLYVQHPGQDHSYEIKRLDLQTRKSKNLFRGSQPDWQPNN